MGLAVKCVPERNGFWFEIGVSRKVKYRIRYFALGTAGYQRQGELEGTAGTKYYRRFIELGFTVVVVGVTDLLLSLGKGSIRGYEVPLVLARSRPLPTPSGGRITGLGRIELSAAARKTRRDTFDGTYGVYGAYGTPLYGGAGERMDEPRKKKRRAKEKTNKKRK
jgi:hypothetical protein